ncbi:MAG: serine O-acetyltransferase [Pseudomonadota bacterium]
MFKRLRDDIRAVAERDPAAHSRLEILLCYPGLHAVLWHRIAHALWQRGFRLLGRLVSNLNRLITGIEIHPGAVLGDGVFIDHGMGVVIGETAVVGNNVTLYQGVTLGGTSGEKGKRHPTIEDDVVIGAGAAVLGPFTVGKGARVGSNAVVLKPVPPGATVVGVPAREAGPKPVIAGNPCFAAYGTDPALQDDPMVKLVDRLCRQVERLETRIGGLERELAEAKGERERQRIAS